MPVVLAVLCETLDEFLAAVEGEPEAQVRLQALQGVRPPRAGENGRSYPIVTMVVTAAMPGAPPRLLRYTESIDLSANEGAVHAARRFATELIECGLRPEAGEWRMEEVAARFQEPSAQASAG